MKKVITLIFIFTLFVGIFNTIYASEISQTEEGQIDTNEAETDETNATDVNEEKKEEPAPNFATSWSKDFPEVNSQAGIIMDADTGTILYGKNINERLYPASITKVLTTLIALENSSMNETVDFSHDAIFNVDLDSSRIGIDVGEQLTIEQSLYGIMLASANEVSYAVAEHIGGDIPTFSKMMNDKVKELGGNNSNFINPHGLPNDNHYTTSYDMALIAREAINNDDFREITKTPNYTIPPTNIQEESRPFANHHKFIKRDIPFDGAIGGKTGWTRASMYTLVTYAERDGMTLISVIMSCPSIQDEYNDTTNLLNYAFDNFKLFNIENTSSSLEDDIGFFTKYSSFFNLSDSPLEVNENGKVILPNDVKLGDTIRDVELKPLDSLVNGVNEIGTIVYSYDGNNIGKTHINYNNTDSEVLLNSLYIDPVDLTPEDFEVTTSEAIEKEDKNPFIPVIVGIAVGLFVLIIGIILVNITNKKRRYRTRRRYKKFK